MLSSLPMQNLLRRGNTWFARLFIPNDRWADVGKAMGAARGIKREVVRTLQTSDRREAQRRLGVALAGLRATVDEALRLAKMRPLTDWTADWADRAAENRAALRAARDDNGGEDYDSDRDLLRESIESEAETVEARQGHAAAMAFYKASTITALTIQEGADAWLAEVARSRRKKTVDGHRKVLRDLEGFLRDRHGLPALTALTFSDVTRRIAGAFIEWRAEQVSGKAVLREFSAPMGLWRWAIRRGHAEANPWAGQTAGLGTAKGSGSGEADSDRRAYTTAELVTLLRATERDWAPNGGGYAATLWDATRLALLTGLRCAELADLRIRDIAGDHSAIHVPRGKTKNARRVVPLASLSHQIVAARLASLPDTSPDAPLWPELPILKLTGSRGGKLLDRFRKARSHLLPNSDGVDFHSLRRAFPTHLEAAMNAGGRVNPTLIDSLMGHARGTLALDRYSTGAALRPLANAVADMEALGLPEGVRRALTETMADRPPMTRFAPRPSTRSSPQADPGRRGTAGRKAA